MGKSANLYSVLIGLALFTITLNQAITIDKAYLNDTAFVTTINNYYGCKVWSNNDCVECSARYAFNAKGICCEIDSHCEQFNLKQGVCEQCYEGYTVVNGSKCQKTDVTLPSNLGCALWEKGVCTKCSQRYYFDSSKVCQPVSDLCSTWDDSGACTSCYYGYVVSNISCVVDKDTYVPDHNPLCKIWTGRVCTTCADRTYFDSNGICQSVSAQCSTWDKLTGECLTCFSGYAISNGACVISEKPDHPADVGCRQWDWANQKCLKCSFRWAFNKDGTCVPVSDSCLSWNGSQCDSCYKGYDLVNGTCLQSTPIKPIDAGCRTWDWDNQKCLECSIRWTFSQSGSCVPVDNNCLSFNNFGECNSCYKGYNLVNNFCTIA